VASFYPLADAKQYEWFKLVNSNQELLWRADKSLYKICCWRRKTRFDQNISRKNWMLLQQLQLEMQLL
jgi:hypothetical protein